MTVKNYTTPTGILREYAEAVRGDWSDFDGRTARSVLQTIAEWIDYPETYPGEVMARLNFGLCPRGEGHWDHYCSEDH